MRSLWTGLVFLIGVANGAPVGLALEAHADHGGVLGDLAEASGGTVVTIQLSCFSFQPDLAVVLNGESVLFQHADACGDNPHTVTSTGTTFDPEQDRNKPVPSGTFVGDCFDSPAELLAFLTQAQPTFALDLDLVGALVVRQGGSQPDAKSCLGSDSLDAAGAPILEAVVPYHCRLHGGNQEAGLGMRGALALRA